MKGSKQSRTDLLEKKIQAAINIIKQLLDENAYLKDLAVGSLETRSARNEDAGSNYVHLCLHLFF